jgi:hypothetical protein
VIFRIYKICNIEQHSSERGSAYVMLLSTDKSDRR